MPKPTMPPKPLLQVLRGDLVARIVGQAGIGHPVHQRMRFEPAGDFQRVGRMLVLAQRQRFQPLQKQERVERAERRADVAQQRARAS